MDTHICPTCGEGFRDQTGLKVHQYRRHSEKNNRPASPAYTAPTLIAGSQTKKSKYCYGCKLLLPSEQFAKCTSARDGLNRICRNCCRLQTAAIRRANTERNAAGHVPLNYSKACGKCHVVKGATEFNRNRGKRDGLCDWCRCCMKEALKARYERRKANRPPIAADMTKQCAGCKETKVAKHFNRGANTVDGLDRLCRICRATYWRTKPCTIQKCFRQLLRGAEERSKQLGIPFAMTVDDCVRLWEAQNGHCALTGDQMEFRYTLRQSREFLWKASLDRKDSLGGYTPENVQLVCVWANFAKYALSTEELVAWCRKVVAYAGRQKTLF